MVLRILTLVASVMLAIVAAVAQPECPTTCSNCGCGVGALSCSQLGWSTCTDSNYPCTITPYCGTLSSGGLIFTDKYCASGGKCQVEDIHVVAQCNGDQYTGDVDSCCTPP